VEDLEKETNSIYDRVKEQFGKAGRVLKLWEACRIINEATASTVLAIEKHIGRSISGPEKKEKAMRAVEHVIDILCNVIDVPMLPNWVELALERYMKIFLMEVASGSIDAFVKTFRDTGVFPPKGED